MVSIVPVSGIQTAEGFGDVLAQIRARDEFRQPLAWGIGYARHDAAGNVLDCRFPVVNINEENQGVAGLLVNELGFPNDNGSDTLVYEKLSNMLEALTCFRNDGNSHPNLDALDHLNAIIRGIGPGYGRGHSIVAVYVYDLDQAPTSTEEAYFRLHLLSHRKVRPHGLNLDGVFSLLPNNLWTSVGPVDPADIMFTRGEVQARGEHLQVYSQDRLPRMTDYVNPEGVRIADADRVRLGAYLADGTTVMHEGFVNFNAGTLGTSMVEGRISAGVVVGAGTDIGGGVSIMGTLSGGNGIIVSIGEDCLLEANSGVGIPLGDRVRVSAGDYIKGTTPVHIGRFDWNDNEVAQRAIESWTGGTGTSWVTIKAEQLAGISDAIFRRNARSGVIEVVPRGNHIWGKLDPALHSN